MDLFKLLVSCRTEIIDSAHKNLNCLNLTSYKTAGNESTRIKLEKLFDVAADCIKNRQLLPMIRHSEQIGRERFESGYDLQDVQTAFNSLEELLWKKIIAQLHPEKLAEALGLVSTVLSCGKENLARTYVSLASNRKTPTLNMSALFEGN